jgi:hypothetical protein
MNGRTEAKICGYSGVSVEDDGGPIAGEKACLRRAHEANKFVCMDGGSERAKQSGRR